MWKIFRKAFICTTINALITYFSTMATEYHDLAHISPHHVTAVIHPPSHNAVLLQNTSELIISLMACANMQIQQQYTQNTYLWSRHSGTTHCTGSTWPPQYDIAYQDRTGPLYLVKIQVCKGFCLECAVRICINPLHKSFPLWNCCL